MSSTPPVDAGTRTGSRPMPSAPGIARGGEVVGELDVRVEPDRHAVGGRRRPCAVRRRRVARGPVIVGVTAPRAPAPRGVGSRITSLGGAVDARRAARPGPARSRCAGRRRPARPASARGSRCGRCGCRRRSRSREPWSSRPAPRSTASARRRSSTDDSSSSRSRSRGVATPLRRFMRRRPTRSATSPLRSRRYGSATLLEHGAELVEAPAAPPTRR